VSTTHRERLVTKEVHFGPVVTLDVVKRKGLVPACRKHVEANLATNTVGEAVVWELVLKRLDKLAADLMFLVKLFKVVALLNTAY